MQQSLPFPITFGNPRAGRPAPTRRPQPQPVAAAAVDPGYVYLSASRTMPGFVQIATSQEDPHGLTWSLQTVSGVTYFRNVFAVRTSSCSALAERFRQAVLFEQIPHHEDLFKIPLRFARNILVVESQSLLPLDAAPRRERGLSMALIATIALALALPFSLVTLAKPRPTAQPAAAPALAPEIAKPQFRFSKM